MPTRLLILVALLSALVAGCETNRTLGTSIDDTGIDLQLKRALLADRTYDTSDIDISVFEGRVMLTGTVRTAEARRELGLKTRSLPGVIEVLNEVRVGAPTTAGQGLRDAVMDEKLGAAMRADNAIYRTNYQIAVSQGTIYLLGVAQGPVELERVTGHAQTIDGANEIISHVIFVGDPRRPGVR
ncbi:hypothetical protein PB2503_02952 [Parvularcula bermudensis HTCC2503]|uniref:BON domain-containing protein n=1 Tax=Parvularcula bermudensis (strain ATCC BAA-594 / HTCC2503 / KCTC 12087) TaxID=314260 RepID=E0TD08_PARBH|nr:BON domain-containing protein [Parvularcula bermudensis]ADM08667.1 hypothetical protein PB2503_02952 [Parvularcula bermudensis HTCC2503]